MANLSIENLAGGIQSGKMTEALESTKSNTPERLVLKEMEKEGIPSSVAPAESSSFGKILSDSIDRVNQYQHEADRSIKELISGRNKNIHETMLTLERADTSLKLMMQVRNKVLEAYREIMKMQI